MSGYSKTPLAKKLGIKTGFKVLTINAPEYYWDLFESLPDALEVSDEMTHQEYDFIHIFATELVALQEHLNKSKPLLSKQGTLWISWPKKSAKIATDVDKWAVMEAGQAIGLVDVKVAAVNETWSGHKFVYRKKDR